MTEFRPHGGYKKLKSYEMATVIYDLTVKFCDTYMTYKTNLSYRTYDQMVQAARSGKQNISEASIDAATSTKLELNLLTVAKGSLTELLEDYSDFIRQHDLRLWNKNDSLALACRQLAYQSNKSYMTYKSYTSNSESFANCLICLINQTTYLLDRQISAVMEDFKQNGGFSERMYRKTK